MITVFVGDNTFEIERERRRVEAGFSGDVEKVDGATLELNRLPDLLAGGTLFSSERLVIVRNLSENPAAWTALGDWLERAAADIDLVLIETKLDKRTKTYKALQKAGAVKEFMQWTERDALKAEQWTRDEAALRGVTLDKASAGIIVRRCLVASDKPGAAAIDQWRIVQALDKLALLDEVTPAVIDEVVEASTIENVFDLFEAALKKDSRRVQAMLGALELSEDPYRLFGLLSGQVFQLAALAVAEKPNADVAKEIGSHPFALGKLAPYARTLGRAGTGRVVRIFADADAAMKSSGHDPWLLIERALMKVAAG